MKKKLLSLSFLLTAVCTVFAFGACQFGGGDTSEPSSANDPLPESAFGEGDVFQGEEIELPEVERP